VGHILSLLLAARGRRVVLVERWSEPYARLKGGTLRGVAMTQPRATFCSRAGCPTGHGLPCSMP